MDNFDEDDIYEYYRGVRYIIYYDDEIGTIEGKIEFPNGTSVPFGYTRSHNADEEVKKIIDKYLDGQQNGQTAKN